MMCAASSILPSGTLCHKGRGLRLCSCIEVKLGAAWCRAWPLRQRLDFIDQDCTCQNLYWMATPDTYITSTILANEIRLLSQMPYPEVVRLYWN